MRGFERVLVNTLVYGIGGGVGIGLTVWWGWKWAALGIIFGCLANSWSIWREYRKRNNADVPSP